MFSHVFICGPLPKVLKHVQIDHVTAFLSAHQPLPLLCTAAETINAAFLVYLLFIIFIILELGIYSFS